MWQLKTNLFWLSCALLLFCLFCPRASAQDIIPATGMDKPMILQEIASINVQLIKQTKISNDLKALLGSKQKQLDDWKTESEADKKAMLEDIKSLQSQYDLSLKVSENLTERLRQLETRYNELNKKYQSEKKLTKFLGLTTGIVGLITVVEAFFLWLSYNR